MKRYAVAMIVSLGFFLFAVFYLPDILDVPMLPDFVVLGTGKSMAILRPTFNESIGVFGLPIVRGLIALGLGFVIMACYIQYLIHMKKAWEITQDEHLQRAYKMEMYSILTSLVPIILFAIYYHRFFIFFIGQTIYNPYMAFQSRPIPVVGMRVLILIPLIFQILAGSSITKWARSMSLQHPENYWLGRIFIRVKNIKLGRLLTVIPMACILGPFITIYGFWAGGKAIMGVYAREGGFRVTQTIDRNQQASALYGQPQGGYSAPNIPSHGTETPRSFTGVSTNRPDTGLPNFCQYCGSPKANPDAQFCAICGRKMQ
jgi:hypothetical protein